MSNYKMEKFKSNIIRPSTSEDNTEENFSPSSYNITFSNTGYEKSKHPINDFGYSGVNITFADADKIRIDYHITEDDYSTKYKIETISSSVKVMEKVSSLDYFESFDYPEYQEVKLDYNKYENDNFMDNALLLDKKYTHIKNNGEEENKHKNYMVPLKAISVLNVGQDVFDSNIELNPLHYGSLDELIIYIKKYFTDLISILNTKVENISTGLLILSASCYAKVNVNSLNYGILSEVLKNNIKHVKIKQEDIENFHDIVRDNISNFDKSLVRVTYRELSNIMENAQKKNTIIFLYNIIKKNFIRNT